MVYHGRVKNGVIVLEGGEHLPEGLAVRIEPVREAGGETVWDRLLKLAGTVKDLPPDASENLDHDLYDSPDAHREARREIAAMFGQVEYWPDYDHKKARRNREPDRV